MACARYVAGIVYYGDAEPLSACIQSLQGQSAKPLSIVVIDHNATPTPADEALRNQHPEVAWSSRPNAGYAGGANAILALAQEAQSPPDAVLFLNADIELAPDFSEVLLAAMDTRPDVALASGKLKRFGTEEIDSAGILWERTRRFRDRGDGELDRGQFDQEERVFAVSGAAMMARASALSRLAVQGEVFDEDFFSYHEDTDLAWRAKNLGFDVLYVPKAQATHRRGWQRGQREQIPLSIRRHSFKNRYLEMIKNEKLSGFLRDLPFIFGMEVARFSFLLMRDRATLRAYLDAFGLAHRAWRKRLLIGRVDDTAEMHVGLGREGEEQLG